MKHQIHSDDCVLVDKSDLRVTRLFFFIIGFLVGIGLGLIVIIEKCDFCFFS